MTYGKQTLRHAPRTGVLAASIGALLAAGGLNSIAFGQDDDEADDNQDERLVVTGTRIRRADDYTAVNATTVVTADDMRDLGVFSVADMINQLPNNIASNTPETNTASAFLIGQSIANLRGLNTYFGTRTLTLVDSRRVPMTNTGGSVDLNTIPSALVSRIETVTGGATATYGADALAGVVNIILDQNKENITVDLSYSTTAQGGGDNIEFSIGAGQEFFDGRGQLSVGFDHTDTEAIDDCMVREICQRGLGLIQNGGFFGGTSRPYEVRDTPYAGQPMWLVESGQRFVVPRTGFTWDDIIDPTPFDGVNELATNEWWTWTEDGKDIVQLYDDLSAEEIMVLRAEGPLGANSLGVGPPAYTNRALRTSTDRQNLFTSFSYELERGITVDVQMSLGQNESIAGQNVPSQSGAVYPGIQADNAFLLQGSQAMQDMVTARMAQSDAWFDFVDIAPYRGDAECTDWDWVNLIPPTCAIQEYVTYYPIYKDWSGQFNRFNTSKTDSNRFSIGASGDLFGEGSWTWDGYISWGSSETTTEVEDYPSTNRANMAVDAVFQYGEDPDDPNAQVVCRINYDDPSVDDDTGDLIRQQWLVFLEYALGDESDQAQHYYDVLSNGCEPLNPFGLAASPGAMAYAFPSIYEGAKNDQEAFSFSISGDAWRGFGAGPMRLAAGIDYSKNSTNNYTKPGRSEILARDFFLNFGDPWAGETSNKEMFVEIDLPLLSDRVAADYLVLNLSDRQTKNESQRLVGTPSKNTNNISSWKASMLWQPLDFMRVRMTRSTDTRAPSPLELYQRNSPSANAMSRQTIQNPWVNDNLGTSTNESTDVYRSGVVGGNTQLDEERAISETLGIVFTPTELLSGLEIAIDYYETSVKGGIEGIFPGQVLSRCELEVDAGIPAEQRGYCNQIEFGPPRDDIDPSLIELPEYSNIEVINASQENTSPYWSRGIDFSVSYYTQLGGGGAISARMLATRFLEQSVDLGGWFGRKNVSGQTGENGIGSFFGGFGTNYSPTPDISGNLWVTYQKNAFSMTAQTRYVGSGRLSIQNGFIGPNEVAYYVETATGAINQVSYAPNLENTTNQPNLPSWTTLNLNFNYNFGRSRLALDRFESLNAYLNITNVGDRVPTFYSGESAGGINATFFSAMGREYRLGVRMDF